jgi:hypothetical protein
MHAKIDMVDLIGRQVILIVRPPDVSSDAAG